MAALLSAPRPTLSTSSPVDGLDTRPERAASLKSEMEVFVPGKGVITIAHVAVDAGDILITSNIFDEEVEIPAHIFSGFEEVRVLNGSL